MHYCFLLSLFIFVISCSQSGNPYESGVELSDSQGHSYFIKATPSEANKHLIEVETKGFQKNEKHIFEMSDPIDTCLFGDLDSNNISELYILTQSQAAKPLTNILGLASVNGSESKPIHAPNLSFRSEERSGFYAGFEAPNTYRFENDKLCEHFKIAKNSPLRSRGIDSARVCLDLYQYEGQWVLSPRDQMHFRK